jgi:hypothetical protein
VVLDNNQVVLSPKVIPPGNERRGASASSGRNSQANELADVVEIEKPSANSTLLRYAKTYLAGIYKISWRDRGEGETSRAADSAENKQHERTLRFAVNPPPSERSNAMTPAARASTPRPAKSGARWRRSYWAYWRWKAFSPYGWGENVECLTRSQRRRIDGSPFNPPPPILVITFRVGDPPSPLAPG